MQGKDNGQGFLTLNCTKFGETNESSFLFTVYSLSILNYRMKAVSKRETIRNCGAIPTNANKKDGVLIDPS